MKEIAKSNILDLKLTPKQQRLLDVLSIKENAIKTHKEIGELAGCSEDYVYYCLKQPHFIQAIRLAGVTVALKGAIPLMKQVVLDGLKSRYMPQQLALQIAGIHQQTPLINVIINQNTAPAEDIDKEIINKIIDIEPETTSV